ncbi:MAG: PqqD family protein [Lachnospiraceae bacterium]|nr:PqqD family protein [Lachnospiraceae bacterium]
MKMKEGLLLTENAGEFYIVPTGEAARVFSGFIRLNESGKVIYEALARGKEADEIAADLMTAYEDLSPETARRAVQDVMDQLLTKGLLQ